jgi:ketosteroid isomerase-like protein
MKTRWKVLTIVLVAVAAVCAVALRAQAKGDDGAAIKALEDRLIAAVKAKDVDAIMKVYVDDESLHVFDVIPPRQYVGAKAYRKDWEGFLGTFEGPLKVEISDLDVTTGGNLAYGHSIQHIAGTDKKDKKVDITFRVTDAYKKIGGHWLIVHEHVSVPVDFDTGKPDFTSKP